MISHEDIVVVQEDEIPRQLWKVGRIEDLLRGRDGNARAARRLKIEPSICKDRFNDCIQ